MAKKAAKKPAKILEEKTEQTSSNSAALERAISQIEKQYGKGSIMQMDESM